MARTSHPMPTCALSRLLFLPGTLVPAQQTLCVWSVPGRACPWPLGPGFGRGPAHQFCALCNRCRRCAAGPSLRTCGDQQLCAVATVPSGCREEWSFARHLVSTDVSGLRGFKQADPTCCEVRQRPRRLLRLGTRQGGWRKDGGGKMATCPVC